MPSFDDRPRNVFRSLPEPDQAAAERASISAPLSDGGLPEQEPITPAPISPRFTLQLTAVPQVTRQLPTVPQVTRQLPTVPQVTRQLSAVPQVTRQLPALSEPGLQRPPLVIKGETKKIALVPVAAPPVEEKKRRTFANLAALALLFLVILLTFLTATPLGQEVGLTFPSLQFGSNLFSNRDNSPNNLVAQATATAIFHKRNDGYDPYINGGQTLTDGLQSRNWPVGQCTYWANLRYHQLTGHWIPWNGNAGQWVEGARLAGWHISQSPHIPSVMVLLPGVQGASGYGHVAVVEGVDGNTVHTSNMNWYSNGGGWDRVSTVDFTTGPGAYFVWRT